jgi:hypothetical protein
VATTTETLLDRLAELDAAVEAARGRVRDRERELLHARRGADAAEAELRDAVRRVEAGEDGPSADEIARLEGELRRAEAGVSVRITDHVRSGPRLEVRHPRAEAAVEGARDALARAEDERGRFVRAHRGSLLAELRPEDDAAARAYREAEAALERARSKVVERRRVHVRVADAGGLEPAHGHLPDLRVS